MSTLTEFLTARLDEDEAVARAAVDPEMPGTHWRWFNDDDTPSVPDPDNSGEYLTWPTSLRTVEEFPTCYVGDLPAFLIATAEEVRTGAGLHIARHDPARVLAEVEAKRRIVEGAPSNGGVFDDDAPDGIREDPWWVLRHLASVYADHPDYREEWRL